MLEMIKKDINLHTQTQDTGIEKAAVKEILILHINGFLYDLRKLVKFFS